MDQHKDEQFGGQDALDAALEAVQEMAHAAYEKRIIGAVDMAGGIDPDGDLVVEITMDAIKDEMARIRHAPGIVVGCGESFDEGDVREAVGRYLCAMEDQYQGEMSKKYE